MDKIDLRPIFEDGAIDDSPTLQKEISMALSEIAVPVYFPEAFFDHKGAVRVKSGRAVGKSTILSPNLLAQLNPPVEKKKVLRKQRLRWRFKQTPSGLITQIREEIVFLPEDWDDEDLTVDLEKEKHEPHLILPVELAMERIVARKAEAIVSEIAGGVKGAVERLRRLYYDDRYPMDEKTKGAVEAVLVLEDL